MEQAPVGTREFVQGSDAVAFADPEQEQGAVKRLGFASVAIAFGGLDRRGKSAGSQKDGGGCTASLCQLGRSVPVVLHDGAPGAARRWMPLGMTPAKLGVPVNEGARKADDLGGPESL
mgnify:FL=1